LLNADRCRYTDSVSPRSRLLVALASTLLIGYVAVGSLLGRVLGDTSYGQLAAFNEVVHLVIDHYVEPVNLDRAMAGARLGLTEALDGESAYLEAEELRLHQQPPRDSDADIGLVLTRRFGFLMVVGSRPGSPAERAGIRTGDLIRTIDGRHTRPLPVPVGQRLLRGAPGSVTRLTVLRAGSEPIEVEVVRERLASTPPRGRVLEDGSGYLKIAEFPPRVAEEVRGEVEALRKGGARTLVLDLRGAAWGTPAEGVKVAELFVKGGLVGKLSGTKVAEQLLTADPGRNAWDRPLAVLVDGGTAGAAEIVAAALLDSGRSPLVGERTFGRAALQKVVPMPEGALLLTVARYWSPKGAPIHGKGIEPSVTVAAGPEGDEPGPEGRDRALEKALDLLKEARRAA
jgi:carboxyl-terminal processing protease